MSKISSVNQLTPLPARKIEKRCYRGKSSIFRCVPILRLLEAISIPLRPYLSLPSIPTIIRYFLTCRAISVNVIAKLFPLQIFSLISILYFKRERFVRII